MSFPLLESLDVCLYWSPLSVWCASEMMPNGSNSIPSTHSVFHRSRWFCEKETTTQLINKYGKNTSVSLFTLFVAQTGCVAMGKISKLRTIVLLVLSIRNCNAFTTVSGSAQTLRGRLTIRPASISGTTSATNALQQQANTKPQSHYDSIISGGGPAGLLTAIMLCQKFGPSHRIALCERRPALPPQPNDATVWNDVARFYLLGIGHRGQRALQEFGVLDDFVKASVEVKGRRDWQPGQTGNGTVTLSQKPVPSRILPRDKLVGVLYHHLVENYMVNASNIDLLYGYEVTPIDFGSKNDTAVSVSLSKCELGDDPEPLCNVGDDAVVSTTKLLIGADGTARTVANAMEEADAERRAKIHPIRRLFAKPPFRVTRFEDDNPRVYKSVPIQLPSDWPCDLNYSARSRDNRITLEALPSDNKGNLCALLLMKPDDELAQANVDPTTLRAFFEVEFPQFSALIPQDEMALVATKAASALPAFRFAGPRLNMGKHTLVLGDAAHTVKPYYGLGANSALEDVQMLSDALDDVVNTTSIDQADVIPRAVQLFSNRRAGDSKALVTISRNMDRPGKLFFVNFLLPLILDGVFHKLAPKIFGPNMFAMFQRQDLGFLQIQRKKRLDRAMQFACLASLFTGVGFCVNAVLGLLSRVMGKSRPVVTLSMVAMAVVGGLLRKLATSSRGAEATA